MHSASLLGVFEKQKGQRGKKEDMATRMTDDIDTARESIIRGLCIFLNEDPDDLVQEYMDMTEAPTLSAIEATTVGIYISKGTLNGDNNDVGVVIEGVVVLRDLDNVALASAMLFGFCYCLNLRYPQKLPYIFEVFKTIIMELDAAQLSKRCKA